MSRSTINNIQNGGQNIHDSSNAQGSISPKPSPPPDFLLLAISQDLKFHVNECFSLVVQLDISSRIIA